MTIISTGRRFDSSLRPSCSWSQFGAVPSDAENVGGGFAFLAVDYKLEAFREKGLDALCEVIVCAPRLSRQRTSRVTCALKPPPMVTSSGGADVVAELRLTEATSNVSGAAVWPDAAQRLSQ